MTWEEATLGDLASEAEGDVKTGPFGSQLHKSDYVDDPLATPVVMPKNMVDGKVDTSSIARIDDETVARLSTHVMKPGDIVLGRRGDIGRRAWIGEVESGWLCGTGSMRITLSGSAQVRSRFVHYFFGLPSTVAWLEGHSVGATMANLSAGTVKKLPVRFPSVSTQDQIVEVLDSFDDLIENNRRRIEILEEMARLLYREWFVHFRFPGHEDVEMVDSELGPIPEGWRALPVSEAVELNPRLKVDKTIEDPFITMGDLSESGMVCSPSERKGGSSGAKFQNGDTLFARITPCLQNGKTGYVQVLKAGEIGRGSTEFVVFRGREIGSEHAYLLARDPHLREVAQRSMTGASGRQRVRNECFDSYLIAVPTEGIGYDFADNARPMFELIGNLAAQNEVLREARDLLLPRLVSGELDVSELDLGEVLG